MRNINPFVIKTLIFCMILFALTTTAHSLALMVRDSSTSYSGNYTYNHGTTGRQDNDSNASQWDISPIANGVGAILLGMDMPMPMPIIVTIWNVVLLTIIAYDVSEIIKAWIPLL
jgi:hypothetical protein